MKKICWLCQNHLDIYECGMCTVCYTFTENYNNELYRQGISRVVTERELREAYAEFTGNEYPRLVNTLLAMLNLQTVEGLE
jgi:hypothetical protein